MGILSKIFNLGVKAENEDSLGHNKEYKSCSGNFEMIVEDVFTITGRGTVVTGKISAGQIKVGDIVTINNNITTRVTGIEAFRKHLDYACTGDNVGLLLEDVDRNMINKNDVLSN